MPDKHYAAYGGLTGRLPAGENLSGRAVATRIAELEIRPELVFREWPVSKSLAKEQLAQGWHPLSRHF